MKDKNYRCIVCGRILNPDEAIVINKTAICSNCYEQNIDGIYQDIRKQSIKYLLKLVALTISYIIGIILIVKSDTFNSTTDQGMIMLLIGVLFCGFLPGIMGLMQKREEIAKREAQRGADYYIYDDGSIRKDRKLGQKILAFVIQCILGIITTPIYILILLVNTIRVFKDVIAIKNSMKKYR